MISAKGLLYASKGTVELLRTSPGDDPLVVQLFGSDPRTISLAARSLRSRGFSFFDLNCGCAVKKVLKTGAGAALLVHPELLFRIAEKLIAEAGKGKVGFKLRLGWDRESRNYLNIAQRLEEMGAGWITLHPRYAAQKFSGKAEWAALTELKKRLTIPLIASGDMFTASDALKCLELTGADAIMFARGALQDPLVFARYKNMLEAAEKKISPLPDMSTVFEDLVTAYKKHDPGGKGLLKLRTLGPRIVRDIPGAGSFRQKICQCRTWEDVSDLIRDLRQTGPGLSQFDGVRDERK
jgi:tRNA-dihydrouridine synthase B